MPDAFTMHVRSGCKINLFLKIRDKRPDGYHNLESFFLPLETPADTLDITFLPQEMGHKGLTVSCTKPDIDPENNTLTKAYALYAEATGFSPALAISLVKNVPHGAGLGGGSANAAVLLLTLQEVLSSSGGRPLDPVHLSQLAGHVGADVPFFLINQPALAQGTGDILTLQPNPYAGLHLVLVCPHVHISTAWAFKELSKLRIKNEENLKESLTDSALRDTTPISHGVLLENDFEEVVFPAFPELFLLWKRLNGYGAVSARLSGTGSSLFGIFEKKEEADTAANGLLENGIEVHTYTM